MNEGRILLVEDSSDDIELTMMAFRRSNIRNEVVVSRDGAEAMALIERWAHEGPSALPALVLLDLKLPKIGGLELLRWIRSDERTRRMPVIILTSSNEDGDLAMGYDLGVNAYVRKPIDFASFGEAIRILGLFWLVVNEAPHPLRIPSTRDSALSLPTPGR